MGESIMIDASQSPHADHDETELNVLDLEGAILEELSELKLRVNQISHSSDRAEALRVICEIEQILFRCRR